MSGRAWWENSAPTNIGWMDGALCVEIGGELFHADDTNNHTSLLAKKACSMCPVISECLEYALQQPGINGIFGGTTERERRKILTRRRRVSA